MRKVRSLIYQLAPPTWKRALCVFGPTQIINYSFVPAHLRLLLLQSVGFCKYLSPFPHLQVSRYRQGDRLEHLSVLGE